MCAINIHSPMAVYVSKTSGRVLFGFRSMQGAQMLSCRALKIS